ncbi:hypothetical protein [Mucilaginibacter polytrichastri]|uniref:Uncharacterized protein n=1 Tax=Mucilaginibacter polytrichastri TaxID=1302689 RepID=A0A1Q5ZVC0_9SPHI|nr:hypothetical protein [Mucilaginibacter polytrichastri]OKS85710.1 hypothetical protein RG47T_1156 [Mucilaginibacter polytrichastri]SFS61904.1 hypothetical protein SAMN04487890_102418 [Mucilaginibacter polytrichastri]
MEIINYPNKWFRYVAALTGTLIILFNGRPFDLLGALLVPLFYVAFVASFLAALFLVHCTHKVSLSLDVSAPWREDFAVRLCYQICLAIVAPAFIDVVLFYVYFTVQGKNIMSNGFLWVDLPLVSILLTVWNIYYWLHSRVLAVLYKRKEKLEGKTLGG